MLKTWFAIALKEFIHFKRNTVMIRAAVIVQALQMALLGFIDINARDLPTAIVDQDQTSESRELAQKLNATDTLEIRYQTSSIDQARSHLRAGRVRVAVVIPPDFHKLRAAHEPAHVLALVDGSDSASSNQAIAAIRGVTAQVAVEAGASEEGDSVRPHTMMLYNPEGKTSSFTLPGLLAILLMGEWVIFAGLAIAREREQETIERLLLAPLHPEGYLLGKVTPYFIGSVLNGFALILVIRFAFGVPLNGSLGLEILAVLLYSLLLVSLGMYFASDADGELEVQGRVNDLTFPILFLCGYIFPLSSLPKWLLPVAYILPPTHMIEVMRGIMLRGIGMADLWPSFLYLTLAPVILIGMATRRVRKSLKI